MRAKAVPIAKAIPRPRTIEEASVLPGTRPRLLGRSAPVGTRAKGWAAALGARRHKVLTGAVAIMAIVVAGLVGALFGSGLYSVDGRFGAERLAAQTGRMELGALPEVPGHPGAHEGLNRRDVVRQMMALDGVQ